MKDKHFDFIVVVWGQEYSDLFFNAVLPNHLQPENLYGIDTKLITYKLYTTSWDIFNYKNNEAFAELKALVPDTQVHHIDDIDFGNKYRALTEAHRRAIDVSNAVGSVQVFLPSDVFWSNGAFPNLLRLGESSRAVLVNNVRTDKEKMREELFPNIVLSPRNLVGMASDHLHPSISALFEDSDTANHWTSGAYWKCESGMISRCFHLHPVLVHPTHKCAPSATVDDSYVAEAVPDKSQWHIVRDSDELIGFELSHKDQCGEFGPRTRSLENDVVHWARHHAKPHHKFCFDHDIVIHHRPLGPKDERDRKAAEASYQLIKARI